MYRTFPNVWICLVLAAIGSRVLTAEGGASDASYFRSDHGRAGARAGSLPGDFDALGVLLWRTPMDSGHSTPVLCGGKIYVTTFRPGSKELATVAVDQGTGKVLWRNPIQTERIEQTHAIGSPATATPACDGERLYVFFGSYGLICYDLEGNKIWQRSLGPFQDEYGAGSSPILADDLVVLNQDHDVDSFVMALDRHTGKTVWKTARPQAVRSYSTPAVRERGGKKELLVAGALELAAYDLVSGEKVWWIDGLARIVIPTPVPSDGVIYMASWAPGGDAGKRLALDPWPAALAKWDKNHDGKLSKAEVDDREVLDRFYRMDLDQNGVLDELEWNRHAQVFQRAQNSLLAIKPSGTGELGRDSVLWKHQKGIPYVSTPLVEQGIVWMVKDGGIVTKLDASTGQLLQEERVPGFGNYFASPVAGDGKVYFASEPGVVSVLAAQREWRVLSSHNFREKIFATPAVGEGRIYIRSEEALYCFGAVGRGPARD